MYSHKVLRHEPKLPIVPKRNEGKNVVAIKRDADSELGRVMKCNYAPRLLPRDQNVCLESKHVLC
jgi:hypothetical protein